MRSHQDYFGNAVTFFIVEGAHKTLTVRAVSTVKVGGRSLLIFARRRGRRRAMTPCRSTRLIVCSNRRRLPSRHRRRLRASIISAGATTARSSRGFDPPYSCRLHLRSAGDDRGNLAEGCRHDATRRLPGLRAAGYRMPAFAGPCRALCQRLPGDATAAGEADSPEWMRRTRGWPFTVQDSAGWTSIPPTTCSPLPHMSRWRGDATMSM